MSKRFERGGVSLFIVIFTALILTIITVGFTQFVIHTQQQILQNDLSDRAYDSALAGVEDAKRVLVAYTKECAAGSAKCSALKSAVDSHKCTTLADAGIASTTDTGGNVETTVGAGADNQAYTCVKIYLQTGDYQGRINTSGGSTLVHLKGVDNFTTIRINWFTKTDSGSTSNNVVRYSSSLTALPPASAWKPINPSILRVQYIPVGGNVSALDKDARTVFLYPGPTVAPVVQLDDDTRRDGQGAGLSPARCASTYAATGGACSQDMTVPSATKDAYLQLTSLYNATSFTITLLDSSGKTVAFDGVAPAVDSTGRAAEVVRRVVARVRVGGVSLPSYPISSTDGNLCKAFTLHDPTNSNPYNAGSCEP